MGELDTEVLNDKGVTHVTQAKKWTEDMNAYAKANDKPGKVDVLIVPNTEHNYGKLVRAGAPFLVETLRAGRN